MKRGADSESAGIVHRAMQSIPRPPEYSDEDIARMIAEDARRRTELFTTMGTSAYLVI